MQLLAPFKKTMKNSYYAIFLKDKVTGKLFGVTENSFSMGISESVVRVWPNTSVYNPKWNSLYKNSTLEKRIQEWILSMAPNAMAKNPNLEIFITRLNSKKCPVKISMKGHNSKNSKLSKYDYRNKQFTLK